LIRNRGKFSGADRGWREAPRSAYVDQPNFEAKRAVLFDAVRQMRDACRTSRQSIIAVRPAPGGTRGQAPLSGHQQEAPAKLFPDTTAMVEVESSRGGCVVT
jgi:hypothetical protein